MLATGSFFLKKMFFVQGDVNGCTGNLNFSKTGERNETFLQMLTLEGLVSGEVCLFHTRVFPKVLIFASSLCTETF